MYADQRRVEHSFKVGDMVYLRLQPYRQSTLQKSGAEKLKPHFYGPFRVIRKVGAVAYELELPSDSRVHNVFHVSHLKKALGHNVVASSQLLPLDEEGQLVLIPEEILDFKEHSLRKRTIREYVVKWKNLPMEDATWESDEILQHPGIANTTDAHTDVSNEQLATDSNEKSIEIPTVDVSEVQTEKSAVDTTVKSSEAQSEKPAETNIEK
ncbi:uncharacterized protein LOC131063923 [Cryptomeria japonica]|uniref:uncharacterized protein LOC131063923 n=1 Tax=Cryptomeria japonica TaxID=3369 RepID=UPI0025ABC3FA|nr:uncharacterized protein LOC131063923 [Cryptomeria japonica]